ncbi:MAG: hypothetical protein QHH26_12905 [Armatimonadota bacterium]|nr:hypothetical protein [Armatimonadota bacterium]
MSDNDELVQDDVISFTFRQHIRRGLGVVADFLRYHVLRKDYMLINPEKTFGSY